jgi:alpha-N-acetylglucosaminidase
MWFDNTETKASLLRDYGEAHTIHSVLTVSLYLFITSSVAANKYWSGLLRDYYGPRAAIYFKYLILSLEKNKPFALEEWRREWIRLTNNWQSDRKVFTTTATGDALNISRSLFIKYLSNADSLQTDGSFRMSAS